MLRILLGLFGLLILISVALYLPPVQRMVINQAASYVRKHGGWQLSLERFRLSFPLTLRIDNALLLDAEGDTLLCSGSLGARVALWPLLEGEVRVVEFALEETTFHYEDTTSALHLDADIGALGLRGVRARLSEQVLEVRKTALERTVVDLSIGEALADTVTQDTTSAVWRILSEALEMDSVVFRMHTSAPRSELAVDLQQGVVAQTAVNLKNQRVAVQSIDLQAASFLYRTDTAQTVVTTSPTDTENVPGKPWTISLDRLELVGNDIQYGSLYGQPTPGFDPSHIQISGLRLKVDSIHNRGTELALALRGLSFRERSGLEVTGAEGTLSVDSLRSSLEGFHLTTPASAIHLQVKMDGSLFALRPDIPLTLDLDARLAADELWPLYPVSPEMRRTWRGRSLEVDGKVTGNLDQIEIQTLSLIVPRHVALRLGGQLRSLTSPDHLGGNLRLYGDFTRIDFLKGLLPDTALRNRLAFPERMTLHGKVRWTGQTYLPSVSLAVDTSRLTLDGRIDLHRQNYQAELEAVDFPLNDFLPRDSLGVLSLQLRAEGQGFDPVADGASADLSFQIGRFAYNGYLYHDVGLKTSLADHRLSGQLRSASEALQLNLDLQGQLRPNDYTARLQGRIGRLDLQGLHWVQEPFSTSLFVETSLEAHPDSSLYRGEVILDSIRIAQGFFTDTLRRTALRFFADRHEIEAHLRSGDLASDLKTLVPIDSVSGSLNRMLAEMNRQIDSSELDMSLLQKVLPPFRLEMTAGRENVLQRLLETRQMSFASLQVNLETDTVAPFHGSMIINDLATGGITLDTLNIGLKRQDKRLDYYLRLANRPGNLEQMALIAVYGNVEGRGSRINFYQRDRSGRIGFQFGLDAQLQDSAVRVSLSSLNPLFGYAPWQVNAGNYIQLCRNRKIYADLRLEHGSQYIRLQPASASQLPEGSVELDMAGIDISSVLEMLPSSPPLDGKLETHLAFGRDEQFFSTLGTVRADSLEYDHQRIGDVGLQISLLPERIPVLRPDTLSYVSDTIPDRDTVQNLVLNTQLDIDAQKALTLRGSYRQTRKSPLQFMCELSSFPLACVNPFLPADAARLNGALQGQIQLNGSGQHPLLDGQLNFTDAQLTVPMIGTSFGLSSAPIHIADNRVTFDAFGLTAPGNKLLSIDGVVDVSDFAQLRTDLQVHTSDFPLINAPRNNRSMVYGKAHAAIDLRAQGTLNALKVRGNVQLLNSTDIFYTLRESPLESQDNTQHIVTFVSFSDSTAMARLDSVSSMQIWGMDALVNVNIDNNVKATVNLSEDGNNRIALQGQGNLTFTMNPQGDTRFTGRYVLSGGTVVYNPPIISQKVFAIDNKSYVEWTGDIAAPSFNITATESVQTTVTTEDNASRRVTFDITVNVRNTLQDLSLTFDLAAPSDISIQNQLLSLSPEQRATQAMALLIYNTYTGPGTTAKIDSNNPLNSFLEKELNQWARNNLRNVDVSFGIHSVNDPTAASGSYTDYSYKVSKNLFNDRVKVTIGGSVNTNTDPAQNMKENFVDDISLEYRLDKRGNMALKVYRYNTQESILEGEVVDTGVGFVVNKKLYRLGNLFRVGRDPEKQQRRAEKKALREQRKQERRDRSVSETNASPDTSPDTNPNPNPASDSAVIPTLPLETTSETTVHHE